MRVHSIGFKALSEEDTGKKWDDYSHLVGGILLFYTSTKIFFGKNAAFPFFPKSFQIRCFTLQYENK